MNKSQSRGPIEQPEYLMLFLALALAACCAAAILYFAHSNPAYSQVLLMAAAAIGCVATKTSMLTSLLLMPSILLLGPMARIPIADRVEVNVADCYILILVLVGTKRKSFANRDSFDTLSKATLFFTVISLFFALQPKTSIIAFIGVVQYYLVFVLTRSYINSERKAYLLLISWLIAVCISASMVIYAYQNGITLLIDYSRGDFISPQPWTRIGSLFRPTSFLPGFIFPMAATIMSMAGLWITNRRANSEVPFNFRSRVLMFAAIAPIVACAVVMANKTVFVSVFFTTVLFCAIRYSTFSAQAQQGIAVAFVIGVCGYLGFLLVPDFAKDTWIATVSSTDSFWIRYSLWPNVLDHLWNSPKELVFGMGPDFSVRNSSSEILDQILVSSAGREGAVDNTYLYVLLDYGVIVFISGLALMWSAVRQVVFVDVRRRHDLEDVLLLIFLLWGIMCISQQCAISKPALMLIQCIAIAANVGTYQIKEHSLQVGQEIARLPLDPKSVWRRG